MAPAATRALPTAHLPLAAAHACRRGSGSGGTLGVLGAPANDEGCKEEQTRFDRVEVVDRYLHRPSTPAFSIENGKLAVSVGERIAFAPTAGRPQCELAVSPAQRSPTVDSA